MKRSRLSIVFSFVGVFWSLYAMAQENCSSIFSANYASGDRVEVYSHLTHAPPVVDFEKTVQLMDSLIAPLEIPTQARIFIGSDFKESSFNAENFQIYVGLRPDSMGRQHPKIHQTVLAHEYGHAIFELNLMKDLESYKNLRNDALNLEATFNKTFAEAKAIAHKRDVTFHNKAKQKELEAEAMTKAMEARALNEKLIAHRKYWTVRRAFHELFADTMALITTRDPKAVSDLLKDQTKKIREHSLQDIYLRDFTDGRNHLDERTWKRGQILYLGLLNDVYFALLPARWALWDITKNKIKSDNYRKELAYKVFSILERNLSEILAKTMDDSDLNGFKNINKINQQLIEDFHREL